jgi:hypothetical protein
MNDIQLTTIIATYGAIIATLSLTLSLLLGIYEIRRDKALIKVSIDYGTLMFHDNELSEPFLLVNVINTGKGKVVLNSFGFLMKDDSRQVITSPYILNLPHELEERRSCVAGYSVRWFKENKRKDDIVAVFIGDETGKQWKSKITKKMKKKWSTLKQEGVKIDWSTELKTYYREDFVEILIPSKTSD